MTFANPAASDSRSLNRLPRHAYRPRTRGFAAFVIGVAAFGLLATLTGLDPFGATSSLPSEQARVEGVGFLLWMIGLSALGARFALRGIGRP